MIFVTLGTQNFQADNLLKNLDILIENGFINDLVLCQNPFNEYTPIHFKIERSMSREKMIEMIINADTVISHAGTGSIMDCEKLRNNYVLYPRHMELGEHVDNHQIEMADVFSKQGNAIVVEDETASALKRAIEISKNDWKKKNIEFNNKELLTDLLLEIEEVL